MQFIVAVLSLLSGFLYTSIIGSGSISDSMLNISNNPMQIRISILGELSTSIAIVFLGVLFFVTLKKQNEPIALVALGLYLIEATLLAVSRISAFSLLQVSQEFVKAGSPDSSHFQTLGTILLNAAEFGYLIHLIIFSIGAILFFYLFFKSRAIPRLLSVWGLIAGFMVLIGSLVLLLGGDLGILYYPMYIPEMVFELAIGLWIMVKGITPYEI